MCYKISIFSGIDRTFLKQVKLKKIVEIYEADWFYIKFPL